MSSEFRRGWPPLLAAFAGTSLGIAALFFYSLGVFIKPLQAQFGWSRAALSLVPLVAILASAALSPVVGSLADKFGPRRVGTASLVGLSIGFGLLAFTPGIFAAFMAATCVLAIAGAASSPVVFSRLVTIWFFRARGLALGVAASGAGLAGILVPKFLPAFVAHHGWRAGYGLLAILPLAGAALVLVLGKDKPASTISTTQPLAQDGFTLAQARGQGAFWVMLAAFFLVALASSGFVVHFIPFLSDAGLSPASAGATASLTGVAILAGRLITGLLLDRVAARWVGAGLFAAGALGCLVLAQFGVQLGTLAALLVGLSFGAEVDLVAFLAAQFFGLRAFGSIFGWLYASFTLGVAAGPPLAGVLHDKSGSYHASLLVQGAALLAAALLMASLRARRVPPC